MANSELKFLYEPRLHFLLVILGWLPSGILDAHMRVLHVDSQEKSCIITNWNLFLISLFSGSNDVADSSEWAQPMTERNNGNENIVQTYITMFLFRHSTTFTTQTYHLHLQLANMKSIFEIHYQIENQNRGKTPST